MGPHRRWISLRALLCRNALSRCSFIAVSALALAGCQDDPVQPDLAGPEYKKEFFASSVARGINTQGQVVGWSGDNHFTAFLWTPRSGNGSQGAMVGLGTLGGLNSRALAINTSGQVVGRSTTSGEASEHAFLWTPKGRNNGQIGSMVDLQTLGGTNSSATAINTQGQVVGQSYLSGNATYHPFLWTPTDTPNGTTGTMVDLGSLDGTDSYAAGINTQGQVVGSTISGRIFLFTPTRLNGSTGTTVEIGFGFAQAINTQGQVVGFTGGGHAFLWTPTEGNGSTGTMVDLGTLVGGNSAAWSINTQGQVVGESSGGPGSNWHAFLWKPASINTSSGTMVDLGTFGGTEADAYSINTQGQVVGYSTYASSGVTHAFLWTPTEGNGTTGTMVDIGTLRK